MDQTAQREVLTEHKAEVCFVRLPLERDGLHCIPLYAEVPVVVVAREHPVTAYDEIPLADLAHEQLVYGEVPGWEELATAAPMEFPELTAKQAVEVVASGTGMMIVPMSVARLHHRKDVEYRPVLGVPETRIGLAWRTEDEDPRIETFIGIVRGRTENSSRVQPAAKEPAQSPKPPKPAKAGRSGASGKTGKPGQARGARKKVRRRR